MSPAPGHSRSRVGGEVGNIVVRHDPTRPVGLFPGYHEDSEATAGAFRGPYHYTGDKAALDEDGYFWFEGRNDDVSGKIRRTELRGWARCGRLPKGGATG